VRPAPLRPIGRRCKHAEGEQYQTGSEGSGHVESLTNGRALRNAPEDDGCTTEKLTGRRFARKAARIRACPCARPDALWWGRLAACGRLLIGPMPALYKRQQAGYKPAAG